MTSVVVSDDKMEVDDVEEAVPEKVNGSVKPGKDHPVMNGDDSHDESHTDGESVNEVANGNHDEKTTTDEETSQNVTDDESVQETSRRSSPRKTPLTTRPEERDYR